YIEKEDFKEEASTKFFRLKLGGEVRLKNAYIIKANSVVKDDNGEITEIHCTYNEDTTKKIKGTLHWVSIKHAVTAEIREYDRLFMHESPDSDKDKDFMDFINPDSLTIKTGFLELSLARAKVGEQFQFQRLGYFNVDTDSRPAALVFNKTVGLRDSWAKQKPKPQANAPQNKPKQPQQERAAISIIQQFGKKYTNLPEEKQAKVKLEIQELAKKVTYDELEPLFGTALKKAGTRIATLIALKVLLKNGLERNDAVNEFISKALEDKNDLLVAEAKTL
ncbi:glutamine--tRNA ligase, partial [Winogradskyella sp.]|nr:glutamine--tRNA ligase [Winogradskyella sp.]